MRSVIIFIWIFCLFGYGMNIYKLAMSDFKEPYKEEVLRGVGIPLGPVGIILGYITFDE